MSNTKKGVPDVTSLLGNIAQKQKNGELGASPIQAVKPVEISAEKKDDEVKEFKSKNSQSVVRVDNKSREADRRPQGGRPSVKRDDIEYMKISPRIPKYLREEIGVKMAQHKFIDRDGKRIMTLDELVTYALEKLSDEVR
ncbi:MAG TPA: hypothetical protein PKI88_04065 [Agitococcus sp.]|nr:hypothetical protein [Agitococcus sp.]HNL36268.1 hypothetical protein [Agitococcus sp.]